MMAHDLYHEKDRNYLYLPFGQIDQLMQLMEYENHQHHALDYLDKKKKI
jgi:hypothetical protein